MNVRPCCDEPFVYLSITTHIPVLPGSQCHTLVRSVSTNPHLPFKTRPIQIGFTRVWQCWILVCVYGIGVYSVYVWLICLAALIYALNFNSEITLTPTTKNVTMYMSSWNERYAMYLISHICFIWFTSSRVWTITQTEPWRNRTVHLIWLLSLTLMLSLRDLAAEAEQ